MTNNREAIARKIAALLSKTVDRGATEEEAMAASQKAAELMASHDIEAGEVFYKSASCVEASRPIRKYGRTPIATRYVPGAIANLCDCKVWKNGLDVTFFGFKADTEVASYLFDLISAAMVSAIDEFKRSADYQRVNALGTNGKTLVTSFLTGMEYRLYYRVSDMARAKKADVSRGTGTGLVVVKSAKVNEELAELGMRFKTVKAQSRVRSFSGYEAGKAAGDRVQINAGIGSTA